MVLKIQNSIKNCTNGPRDGANLPLVSCFTADLAIPLKTVSQNHTKVTTSKTEFPSSRQVAALEPIRCPGEFTRNNNGPADQGCCSTFANRFQVALPCRTRAQPGMCTQRVFRTRRNPRDRDTRAVHREPILLRPRQHQIFCRPCLAIQNPRFFFSFSVCPWWRRLHRLMFGGDSTRLSGSRTGLMSETARLEVALRIASPLLVLILEARVGPTCCEMRS